MSVISSGKLILLHIYHPSIRLIKNVATNIDKFESFSSSYLLRRT